MKTPKEKIFDRRVVGVKVTAPPDQPSCRLVYEVSYSVKVDGTYITKTKIEYGRKVGVNPSFEELNTKKPSKRQYEEFALQDRADLYEVIVAARALLRQLSGACEALDSFHGIHQGYQDDVDKDRQRGQKS